MTVARRMIQVNNRSSGFDYLRVLLASSIIVWHTLMVSYGPQAQLDASPVLRTLVLAILPMFFSLSGFLVAGSLERSRQLHIFFGLRILRIIPALTAEVTISALILGPMLTSLPLGTYFSDHQFWAYLLNVLGDVHFNLPGVFLDNPVPGFVNMQLWTIPFELQCYIALAGLAIVGLIQRKALFLLGLVLLQLVFAFHGFHERISADRITVGGSLLVLSFLFGVALYVFRERIAYRTWLGVTAGAVMLLCLSYPSTRYISALPAAYFTLYLGLLNPPRLPIVFSGDYSYGLYLYGFPLQQAVAHFPPLREWYINLVIVYPLAVVCAVASWWLLEKPALTLRRFLKPYSGQLLPTGLRLPLRPATPGTRQRL